MDQPAKVGFLGFWSGYFFLFNTKKNYAYADEVEIKKKTILITYRL